jgi:acetyl-CoA C-acetyltransferase
MVDGMLVTIGAGQEQISLVQNAHNHLASQAYDSAVTRMSEHAYMPMLQTAERVGRRYEISRCAQDAYALQSQRRTAAAQAAGLFADEVVPVTTRKRVVDKASGALSYEEVRLTQDEGNRPATVLADLQRLQPVIDGGSVTAGNASQLSDGASACVLVEDSLAARLASAPLGLDRGIAFAGLAPEEMGLGPLLAVPKLLRQQGLSVDDIGLWEINKAFACQVLYCAKRLGIDPARLNVNGGAIAIGHPYGMSGGAHGRPRLAGRQKARGQIRRGLNVCGRRDGRRGVVRSHSIECR